MNLQIDRDVPTSWTWPFINVSVFNGGLARQDVPVGSPHEQSSSGSLEEAGLLLCAKSPLE